MSQYKSGSDFSEHATIRDPKTLEEFKEAYRALVGHVNSMGYKINDELQTLERVHGETNTVIQSLQQSTGGGGPIGVTGLSVEDDTGAVIGTEPIIQVVNPATTAFMWLVVDDPINTRVKITPVIATSPATSAILVGTNRQLTVAGTSNRITSSAAAQDLSADRTWTIDIAATYIGQTSITTLGTIATGIWQATKIGLAFGGTNADLSLTGGAGNYLKQSSVGAAITVGTIPASDIASGAALTKTDDTNVTLTLGGTPATALLAATSLTLGWAGTLAAARLNANVVQSVTNDTNVTGSIATQTLTLGWIGTLADARLSTTAVTPGTYGSATQVGVFTVGATGRITSASNTTITPTAGSITGAQNLSVGNSVQITSGSGTGALLVAATIDTIQDIRTSASPTFAGALIADMTMTASSIRTGTYLDLGGEFGITIDNSGDDYPLIRPFALGVPLIISTGYGNDAPLYLGGWNHVLTIEEDRFNFDNAVYTTNSNDNFHALLTDNTASALGTGEIVLNLFQQTGVYSWEDSLSIPMQRFTFFKIPSGSSGASTVIGEAATVAIEGAPIDDEVVFSNKYAFWVMSGKTQLDGSLVVEGSAAFDGTATFNDLTTVRTDIGALVLTGTTHSLLYTDGSDHVTGLPHVAAGSILKSATTTSAPTWSTDLPTAVTIGGAYIYRVTGTDVALADGGTNASLTASNGGIFYSTATAGAILAGTATSGLALISGASTTPSWFAPTAGSVLFAGTGGILQQDNSNFFWDDTANGLALGTTTVIQTLTLANGKDFAIHNITPNATDYEQVRLRWTSNVATFGTEKGGTGTARNLSIQAATVATAYEFILSTSSPHWKVTSPASGGTATGGIFQFALALNSNSAAQTAVGITPTYTQSSTAGATDLKINRTETSLGSGTQLLFDAQVGGTSKCAIDNKGNVGLATTSFGTSAVSVFAIKNGTAPSSSPTDTPQMYAADIAAGNSAFHMRTENGAVLKLYRDTGWTLTTGTATKGGGDTSTMTLGTAVQIIKALQDHLLTNMGIVGT